MNLTGKKILVIGGAGFIGSYVVEQLLEHDCSEVIVYDNFYRGQLSNISTALTDSRCKIFEDRADIRNYPQLLRATQGVDAVVHLAGAWLLECIERPDEAFEINARGTFNVIQACIANNVQRIVFSSSASVYGDAVTTPMTEDHPFNNYTLYGATKIAGEQLIKSMLNKTSVQWVALRYMNVYGVRQDYKGAYTAVIHKILDRIFAQQPPVIYGDGKQTYDFIDVRDVARANILSLKSDCSNVFLNISTGIGTSIEELVNMILELEKSDLRPAYRSEGQTFVTKRIGSTDAAKKQIGFSYKIELRDGLKKLIEWRKRS